MTYSVNKRDCVCKPGFLSISLDRCVAPGDVCPLNQIFNNGLCTEFRVTMLNGCGRNQVFNPSSQKCECN